MTLGHPKKRKENGHNNNCFFSEFLESQITSLPVVWKTENEIIFGNASHGEGNNCGDL